MSSGNTPQTCSAASKPHDQLSECHVDDEALSSDNAACAYHAASKRHVHIRYERTHRYRGSTVFKRENSTTSVKRHMKQFHEFKTLLRTRERENARTRECENATSIYTRHDATCCT
ncbi:hypothetical protein MRB53_036957 [Persea americana]|nr:hypothetical protein MRB53_036957 [Persea americana]